MKKVQVPVMGGMRKVILPGGNTAPSGTTIAEVGSGTITISQLAAVITSAQAQQQNTGGGNISDGTEASLSVGPGLFGGGPMIGNVPLRLTAPIPWFDDAGGGGDGDPGPPGAAGAKGADGANGANGTAGTTLVYANSTIPAGNTVANTSSETFFTSAYTLPAGTLTVGMVIRLKLFGIYSTGIAAPSLILKIYFGTTVMVASGTLTMVGSITNDGWSAEGLFIVQTIGSMGSVEAQGLSEFSTAATAVLFVNMDNTTAVTLDTTVAQTIQISVQWGGTVTSSDTITLREITIEVLAVEGIPAPSPAPPFSVFFGEDGEDGEPGPPGVQGAAGTGTTTVALPGTIPNLALWWESDDILGTAGATVYRLRERTPWITGLTAANSSSKVQVAAATLNALPVIQWSSGQAGMATPFTFAFTSGVTYFCVFKPNTSSGTQAIIGGTSAACALYLNNAGSSNLTLVKTGSAAISSATSTWTTGTWYQANATYDPATGNYAFRQARAAAGSGTGVTAATGAINFIGGDTSVSTNELNGASLAALIAYSAILTSGQINSVETYLNTKWGV